MGNDQGKKRMPARRSTNLRQGDHGERFAEFVLGSFAFTTRVPRPEDIGHDFHCVLAERDMTSDRFLLTGPSFTVQVKSDDKELSFDLGHQVQWAARQENPFFLCVVTRADLRCDLYTTWNRMNGFLLYGDTLPAVLIPGQGFALPSVSEDVLRIPLGPPILSLRARDAADAKVGWVADVIRPWIQLDRRNIVNAEAGMHWVEGPPTWTTNEAPPASDMKRFYWNSRNLIPCIDNVGRTAIALRKTIEKYTQDTGSHEYDVGFPDLDAVFARFSSHMDEYIVRFHERYIGQSNPADDAPRSSPDS
jgi:hypothetical protein